VIADQITRQSSHLIAVQIAAAMRGRAVHHERATCS
jgi:hypothetical protein